MGSDVSTSKSTQTLDEDREEKKPNFTSNGNQFGLYNSQKQVHEQHVHHHNHEGLLILMLSVRIRISKLKNTSNNKSENLDSESVDSKDFLDQV